MDAEKSLPPAASTDDRRFRRLGLWTVLTVFGGFGAWAALAPLDSAAVAPGVIMVESYRKTVQHLEGGIIKAIHVRDGDAVSKDTTLVILDDTQSRAQLEMVRGQYFIAVAREARLLAQRDGRGQVEYPPLLLERQKDPRVQDAVRVQDQTFKARKTAQEGEVSLYERQIGQLQAKASGLRAQKRSRDELVNSYRGELKDFEALLEEGFTEKQKVRELARNMAQSEGQAGELLSDIAATQLQVSETQLKILQLKKDLQREVAKELSEVQRDQFDLQEKIRSLENTVQRTVIKAPESGIVMGLTVHTIGAVVPPGGKLLEIVPGNEKLLVEAQVSPLDVDRVRVGQTAEVRLTAFKSRDTPSVYGKLIAVSADRLMDEKEKFPFYLARVEINAAGMEYLAQRKLALVPGMPSEVLINTGEHTLFRYLMDPLKSVVARSFTEY